MGATFDAVASATGFNATTTTLTFSHTCGASATLLRVFVTVGPQGGSDAGASISGVTYNGVAMTAEGPIVHNNGNTAGFSQVWYLLNPTTGSAQNVVITRSGGSGTIDLIGNAVSYNGADVPTSVTTTTGATTPTTGSKTPATGEMASQFVSNGAAISGLNQTQRFIDNVNTSSAAGNMSYQDVAGDGTSKTLSAATASDWWSQWVSIIPALAGGSAPSDNQAVLRPGFMSAPSFPAFMRGFAAPFGVDTGPGDQAPALAETGAGAEALSTTATLAPADTGAGTDALAVATATPLSDTGSGTDALTTSATVPPADTGAGADALSVAATLSLSDTGTGADAASVAAALTLADAGAGVDALSVATDSNPALSDTGAAADALSVTAARPTSDAAAGADAATVAAALPLTETGSGAQALTVAASTGLGDTASASEGMTITVLLTLTETASAADLSSLAASVALSQLGTALDVLAVQQPGVADGTGVERPRFTLDDTSPELAVTSRTATVELDETTGALVLTSTTPRLTLDDEVADVPAAPTTPSALGARPLGV